MNINLRFTSWFSLDQGIFVWRQALARDWYFLWTSNCLFAFLPFGLHWYFSIFRFHDLYSLLTYSIRDFYPNWGLFCLIHSPQCLWPEYRNSILPRLSISWLFHLSKIPGSHKFHFRSFSSFMSLLRSCGFPWLCSLWIIKAQKSWLFSFWWCLMELHFSICWLRTQRSFHWFDCFWQWMFLFHWFDCSWSRHPIRKWVLGWFPWVLFWSITLFKWEGVQVQQMFCQIGIDFLIEVLSSSWKLLISWMELNCAMKK